nr:MAG: hypothetical protein [Bacteriophage sp.]
MTFLATFLKGVDELIADIHLIDLTLLNEILGVVFLNETEHGVHENRITIHFLRSQHARKYSQI